MTLNDLHMLLVSFLPDPWTSTRIVNWGGSGFRAEAGDISFTYFFQISRNAGRYFGKFFIAGVTVQYRHYSMCAARGDT